MFGGQTERMRRVIRMKDLSYFDLHLKTQRTILRTLHPEAVEVEYVEGINDPEVYRYMLLADKGKQSAATIKTYVRDNLQAGDAILFGIFLQPEELLIGTIRLSGISYFHFCCDVGICIFGKRYWGRGLANEALKRVVDYAFDDLNMHYIEAGFFSENTSSSQLFKSVGFEKQYEIRNKLRLGTTFGDATVMACINHSFDVALFSA